MFACVIFLKGNRCYDLTNLQTLLVCMILCACNIMFIVLDVNFVDHSLFILFGEISH